MSQKFPNNARALLTSSISAVATSLTVEAGKADLFPVATTSDWLAPADWFRVTLEDNLGNFEIIKVGTRAAGGGVFSVLLRGQEGTTAVLWTAGAVVESRFTGADIGFFAAGNFEDVTTPGSLTVAGKITHNGVESRAVPVGGIIMWSGAVVDIDDGWQLCDGTNGTPNLRDKFVVGAGTTYAVGATGGSKDAIAVTHGHTAIFSGSEMGVHGHNISDPGHVHNTQGTFLNYGATPNSSGVLVQSGGTTPTLSASTGVTVVAATAGTPSGIVAVDNGGASGTNANLPPYYALAYIMCMGYA